MFERLTCGAWASVVWLSCTGAAFAQNEKLVDLEWRPSDQTVSVGETVEIGLYAVAGGADDVPFAALQAILAWDPSFLELLGNNDNGPFEWLTSEFFDDSIFDGLNKTWLDGDALYLALAPFEPPIPFATPEGLLVTTMEFTALSPTDSTEITIPLSAGKFTETIVLPRFGGLPITGTLGSAQVTIVPEPGTLVLVLVALGGCLRHPTRFWGGVSR